MGPISRASLQQGGAARWKHLVSPGYLSVRTNPAPSPYSEVHLAIGTVLTDEGVIALAHREGWLAQRSPRGGLFDVVELWVENKLLLEVLPKAQQPRYFANLTADKFRERFEIENQQG